MMEIKELESALNNIKENYDAFYIENKYGNNTHKKEFDLLSTLEGDKVENAIAWIKNEYDCFYKNEYEDETGTAFEYLRGVD